MFPIPSGEYEVEVELLKNNPDFLTFLRQLSREDATISLDDLRKELALWSEDWKRRVRH